MANGSYEGKDVHHPDIRAMFTREALLASDWYHERLETKQVRDIALWKRHVAYLDTFANRISHQDMVSTTRHSCESCQGKAAVKRSQRPVLSGATAWNNRRRPGQTCQESLT